MPTLTFRFLPENGTLAAGVREPTALVQNGLASYINLDPEGIDNDVEYEADALPASATPAWTKNVTGSPTESVSGGVLTNSISSGNNDIFYTLNRSMATGSPAYIAARFRLTTAGHIANAGRAASISIWDGTRLCYVSMDSVGVWLSNVDVSIFGGVGVLDTASFHVLELCKINNSYWVAYYDGKRIGKIPYADAATSVANRYLFRLYDSGGNNNTAEWDYVHGKDTTLWPASSPTADFVFDSGIGGTVWDMSTIKMLENLFGEEGSLKYKYGAADSGTPSLNGSFLTQAQLQGESDPTGRYLRINVQLNGDGSQDAGWGGMEIAAAVPARIMRGVMRGA